MKCPACGSSSAELVDVAPLYGVEAVAQCLDCKKVFTVHEATLSRTDSDRLDALRTKDATR